MGQGETMGVGEGKLYHSRWWRANARILREFHRTLIKTQDYLDVFARFKQKENIEAVERMLTSRTELELFERSQLGMLAFFLRPQR